MKKTMIRGALILSVVLLSWSGWSVWNTALRAPSFNRLPLPSALIAADSSVGQQLFVSSQYTADYDPLITHFVAQARPAFCGVASSVVVLNALNPAVSPAKNPVTQSTFVDAVHEVPGRVSGCMVELHRFSIIRGTFIDGNLLKSSAHTKW